MNLLDSRSKIHNKKKLKNYVIGTSKAVKKETKANIEHRYVANTPRVGVQAKNSSIISKTSSCSEKKHESTKIEDRESVISKVVHLTNSVDDHNKFASVRKSTQVNPKVAPETSTKKGKLYTQLKNTSARNHHKNSKNKRMITGNIGFTSLKSKLDK